MGTRIVWRTDVHMSDTNPLSRTDVWVDTVLDKLKQVGDIARKHDAAIVLDGGDFFHVKSPGRNSHDMVRRVAELHKGNPCPTYANVGNHDCVYGDYSYLDQQPLGVLFSSHVFERCYDDYEVFVSGTQVFPYHHGWMREDPFTLSLPDPIVRVVGIPYHGTTYDMDRFARIKKGREDVLVCHAHLLASPSGGSMFESEDIVRYQDLLQYDPDVFCFGHWHKNQSITVLGGKTIINIGSLTRGSLSQDDLKRIPSVAMIDCDMLGVHADQIPLQVMPPEKVFDLEARERAIMRSNTIDTFVDSVKQRILTEAGKDITDIVGSMDVPQRVKERVLMYLEQVKG